MGQAFNFKKAQQQVFQKRHSQQPYSTLSKGISRWRLFSSLSCVSLHTAFFLVVRGHKGHLSLTRGPQRSEAFGFILTPTGDREAQQLHVLINVQIFPSWDDSLRYCEQGNCKDVTHIHSDQTFIYGRNKTQNLFSFTCFLQCTHVKVLGFWSAFQRLKSQPLVIPQLGAGECWGTALTEVR